MKQTQNIFVCKKSDVPGKFLPGSGMIITTDTKEIILFDNDGGAPKTIPGEVEVAIPEPQYVTLTENTILTAEDSGNVYFFDNGLTGIDVTLPAPASGLIFEFYVKTPSSGPYLIYAGTELADNIISFVGVNTGTGLNAEFTLNTLQNYVGFSGGAPEAAYIKVTSDGTKYYANLIAAIGGILSGSVEE